MHIIHQTFNPCFVYVFFSRTNIYILYLYIYIYDMIYDILIMTFLRIVMWTNKIV